MGATKLSLACATQALLEAESQKAPATPSGWLYEPETRCRGLLIPKDLKSSLWRGDWRKPKMMKKRVVPAGKLRHLARSVSTVAESKVSVEETVRMAPQCWKD